MIFDVVIFPYLSIYLSFPLSLSFSFNKLMLLLNVINEKEREVNEIKPLALEGFISAKK